MKHGFARMKAVASRGAAEGEENGHEKHERARKGGRKLATDETHMKGR